MVRRRSASPDKTVTKAKSTNDLSGATADRPSLHFSPSSFPESDFSTLKDPRLNGNANSDLTRTTSAPPQHPDLSNEVTTLSAKLIQAINNQTTLDDTLVATRQELENAQKRIQSLEAENIKYRKNIDDGIYIKKTDAVQEIEKLKAALAQEKAQRALVEQGKKTIEQELESLTAALFEEANKMVAAAKIERDAVEKKNEQLRAQIKDTESLLASHQEQLSELKTVMQGMSPVKDDSDNRTVFSVPASPAGPQPPLIVKNTTEVLNTQDVASDIEELSSGPSTSFSNLIKTVCRTDLQAYSEFRDMLTQSKSSKPPSRSTSGSYSGLNVIGGLASLAGNSNGGSGSVSPSPVKSQQTSAASNPSSPSHSGLHIPLKETRFYKRVLMEDIEPTLRLDASPGISWLARRTIMSAICDGSLVVEPMPSASKKWAFPCSLCGERRDDIDHERTHRFRTSDNETAQRYPLCGLCLEKLRSCCEFAGYLRLILDGHVRIGDVEDEKDAWEETVRLRERIFWSRVGAGVVPIFALTNTSERSLPPSDSASQNTYPPENNCENDDQ
ncbi:RAB3A interacting protein [Monascus purpureus]|uniref:RAB3A interacting protein n=1 Tax=Monascus purpureus TaxID=5098 RepID=A0A507QPP4_MONPU|nr:RAB3A interacting protein [Monascus purpureus]